MTIEEIYERASLGEVVIVEAIDLQNGNVLPVDEVQRRYPVILRGLTVQDDWDQAGVWWIFDEQGHQK